MRVLHVYSGNLYGGVERCLATFAAERHLCADMEPHFALCFEGRLSSELRALKVPVHILRHVRASRPWTLWRARRELRGLLGKGRYDAAVCHSPWVQAVFARAVRPSGAPLAFWLHGPVSGRGWVERWAARSPPALAICNSHFTAHTLSALYPGVRSEVIYCPVSRPAFVRSSVDERHAVRRALSVPPDAVLIIQVSRLEPWKGQHLLIDALADLKDVPGWVLLEVGGPQRRSEDRYQSALRDQARESGLESRIRFLGERDDVFPLLRAADIFCQPNVHPESFGLSFVEALQAGLPVVTAPIGGPAEILGGDCALFVPPGDVESLRASLRRLILDDGLRYKLGSSGPARATALSDPQVRLTQLHHVLAGIVGQQARADRDVA